jgi:hypothetical protein
MPSFPLFFEAFFYFYIVREAKFKEVKNMKSEEQLLAEGWQKKAFGWILKTSLGTKVIYKKKPRDKIRPHNFLGRGNKRRGKRKNA